jgi:uncharacterized protein (TIGR02186 family)
MSRFAAGCSLARLGAALTLAVGAAQPACGDALVADLTSHLIGITAGFTGASVVLFGATDVPGDIIAVVRGPEREMTVRHKAKIMGIWVNTSGVTFANVPSFYALASSRPLGEVVTPAAAAIQHIGLANLRLQAKPPTASEEAAQFAEALVRQQVREGLFSETVGKVNFLGERLFRTTIGFPANVPTGTYLVEIFLVRDGDIVTGQTTPLVVSQIGVDAAVFDFAGRHAALYGAIAVLVAVVAGWVSSLPFRNA